MKNFAALLFVFFLISCNTLTAQNNSNQDILKNEFDKALPEDFKFDESGTDGDNLYLVYKKSPQEVIGINLQRDHQIEFSDTETVRVNDHKAIFYYAGFKKNAQLVVYLKNNAGYLVIGYTKPYMGDEIVKMDELTAIAEKVDFSRFE